MESVDKILGESPSPGLVENIEEIIKKLQLGDLHPHHYHIHNYVSKKELSFHIILHGNMSIREGHVIASKIESKINEELGISTTIHVDPDVIGDNV